MKRSHEVQASLVVAIAASLTAAGCGCGSEYVDQCVDSMGRVLPDASCSASGAYPGAHWIHVETGGFGNTGGGYYGGGYYGSGGGGFGGGFGG